MTSISKLTLDRVNGNICTICREEEFSNVDNDNQEAVKPDCCSLIYHLSCLETIKKNADTANQAVKEHFLSPCNTKFNCLSCHRPLSDWIFKRHTREDVTLYRRIADCLETGSIPDLQEIFQDPSWTEKTPKQRRHMLPVTMSTMHNAVRAGDVEKMIFLKEMGISFDEIDSTSPDSKGTNFTPISVLIAHGPKEAITHFMNWGVNPNGNEYYRPINAAYFNYDAQVISKLEAKGADYTQTDQLHGHFLNAFLAGKKAAQISCYSQKTILGQPIPQENLDTTGLTAKKRLEEFEKAESKIVDKFLATREVSQTGDRYQLAASYYPLLRENKYPKEYSVDLFRDTAAVLNWVAASGSMETLNKMMRCAIGPSIYKAQFTLHHISKTVPIQDSLIREDLPPFNALDALGQEGYEKFTYLTDMLNERVNDIGSGPHKETLLIRCVRRFTDPELSEKIKEEARYLEKMQYLFSKNVDVEERDDLGNAALHIAAENMDFTKKSSRLCMSELFKNKARVDALNKARQLPLHRYAAKAHSYISSQQMTQTLQGSNCDDLLSMKERDRVILSSEAFVEKISKDREFSNFQDQDGNTPLHLTFSNNNYQDQARKRKAIQDLLLAGSSVDIPNNQRQTVRNLSKNTSDHLLAIMDGKRVVEEHNLPTHPRYIHLRPDPDVAIVLRNAAEPNQIEEPLTWRQTVITSALAATLMGLISVAYEEYKTRE